ncbi:MAG: RdgB/HAM1 family non-canonical purine NTP pyrophosphatase [Firmicutes bacterium]|nr:RdgB/HAM1 family non-canonical purine NTP pyrophosphatase [Bacillota bacterium]
MKKIIFASNNVSKIKEVKNILGHKFEIVSMGEAGLNLNIQETGTTFEENAIIKAKAVYDILKVPVIADDSGLSVDYLNGEPGVNTAMYYKYGDDRGNNQKLINNLKSVYNRDAKFICVIAYIDENGELYITKADARGKILHEECGTNGFAYDSIFYSLELGKSFGEASEQEKNMVSHRAKAIEKLYRRVLCVIEHV